MYNDAGLSGVTAFGGFAAFVVMYPMAKNKQLPYFLAYVDRFLKFLPSMIFITALDFIWPLTGSGPFHSHLSENIVDRCTRGWWANILMVSNIIDPEDTVSTFHIHDKNFISNFTVRWTHIFRFNDASSRYCCSHSSKDIQHE